MTATQDHTPQLGSAPADDAAPPIYVQPSVPLPIVIPSLVLGVLLFAACFAAAIARLAISIRDGCFFTGPSDFDKFRETGSVCDANIGVNFVIGGLLSIEGQIDIICGVVPLFKIRLAVLAAIGTIACWSVARLATMVTLIALGLPFSYYGIPAVIAFCVGVPQLVSLFATLHYTPEPTDEQLKQMAEQQQQLEVQQQQPGGATSGVEGSNSPHSLSDHGPAVALGPAAQPDAPAVLV